MTKQTSASDRTVAIRTLLDEFEGIPEAARQSLEIRMAEALNAALAPAVVAPQPHDLAVAFSLAYAKALPTGAAWEGTEFETAHAAGLEAVYQMGIDAAHQSWEPDEYAEPENVTAALRRALLDRGDKAAADWLTAHEDEVWGSDIGPLLDAIQRDHGAVEDPWSIKDPTDAYIEVAAEAQADAVADNPPRLPHDVEQAIRSEARTAITDRRRNEFDEHDSRL